MKKLNLLLIITVLFLITNLSYSQNNDKSPEARARDITNKLDSKLSLTDVQDTMVYNAYKDFYSSLSSFYNENSQKNKDEMKQLIENARKDLDTKMSTILTPEQYDNYKQFQSEMDKNKSRNKDNSKWKNRNQ